MVIFFSIVCVCVCVCEGGGFNKWVNYTGNYVVSEMNTLTAYGKVTRHLPIYHT